MTIDGNLLAGLQYGFGGGVIVGVILGLIVGYMTFQK